MRIPLFGGFLPFRSGGVLRDMGAGLVLACMNIPQVLGYTRIAAMPPVTGLYTVLLPPLGFALFGSSRHLVVAADSATAAIISGTLAPLAEPMSARYIELVGCVALMSAIFLLIARLFKLGFIADFLSRTVLVGFLSGVGVQVAISMLGDMLGHVTQAHNPLHQLYEVALALPQVNWRVPAISGGILVAIALGNRFAAKIPLSFFLVILAIIASYEVDFPAHGIPVIGAVAGGFPTFGAVIGSIGTVGWDGVISIMPVAASCVTMIIAQSAATSRAFGEKFHENVDENADILGLAAANAAAGLSGTFVVNASPTQTMMAQRAGARSQLSQVCFSVVVLVVLLAFTAPLHYLPRCVLGAVVFSVAIGMIDIAGLREIRRESPGEFMLAVTTAAAVVCVGVQQGILLAFALSLFRHVRHSYRPHAMMLTEGPNGDWEPAPAEPGMQSGDGFIIYRFGADLFYANCQRFAQDIRALVARAPSRLECIIIDCSAITDIDFSAAGTVRDLVSQLQAQHVEICFARVSPFLHADLVRHRIAPLVGEACIFPTLHLAVGCVRERIALRGSQVTTKG